ncbi:DUF72 domain-containing protein [Pedobacter sp.]|uniref:DUF72 domain-containing protein n=1 Tax=Pedobacter sp. TaxID=1411316 RepID=UPI00396C3D8A
MKEGKIYIGTSGWKYRHWNGVFYPEELKQKDQLDYYCRLFNTVELNNSFYRQPSAENFSKWRVSTPPKFCFSVKANRYFTHVKKLRVDADDLKDFFDRMVHLKEKLGPVLFQLPPGWKIDIERLENFLGLLSPAYRYTFEFRNHSWYEKEVIELLSHYNVAFCIYELAGHLSPLNVTANFVYIRLHGPGEKYQGSYQEKELKTWAEFAKKAAAKSKDVYIYFDNDQAAYAAFNAKRLIELVKS